MNKGELIDQVVKLRRQIVRSRLLENRLQNGLDQAVDLGNDHAKRAIKLAARVKVLEEALGFIDEAEFAVENGSLTIAAMVSAIRGRAKLALLPIKAASLKSKQKEKLGLFLEG